MSETKTCSKCGEVKTKQDFYARRDGKDGLSYNCKSCANKSTKRFRHNNAEKTRETHDIWLSGNPEKNREYHRRYRVVEYAKCPEKARRRSRGSRFKQKYWPHLTKSQALVEWQKMYDRQSGLCKICKSSKPLDVDHDHETGKVRALLCNGCNTALGRIEDNFDTALGLAKYLLEFKGIV